MHWYPSDITRAEFDLVRKELEAARKITKPRKTDLYAVFCAVMYVVKSGCQWRSDADTRPQLPSDFPKWNNGYNHFRIWREKKDGGDSILEAVLSKLSVRCAPVTTGKN
jgi:transposase